MNLYSTLRAKMGQTDEPVKHEFDIMELVTRLKLNANFGI